MKPYRGEWKNSLLMRKSINPKLRQSFLYLKAIYFGNCYYLQKKVNIKSGQIKALAKFLFYYVFFLALDDRAQHLRTMSDKYKKDSHKLNMQSTYARIGAIVVFIIIILLVLKFYLF